MKNSTEILAPLADGFERPQAERKIEFTDVYGGVFKGQYLIEEDMFFIGFALCGDFRYSHEIHEWHYVKC